MAVMQKVDKHVTVREAHEMFEETDKDKSGTIEWSEFHDAVLGDTASQGQNERHELPRSNSHMHLLIKKKMMHDVKTSAITRMFVVIFVIVSIRERHDRPLVRLPDI